MKGSIRLAVGFLIVLGSVGTLETNVSADLSGYAILAIIGFLIMCWGVSAIPVQRSN